MDRNKALIISGTFYSLFACVILFFRTYQYVSYVNLFNTAIGVFIIFNLSSHLVEKFKWKINETIAESSFFIYAYHGIFLTFLIKVVFKLLDPNKEIELLVLYFMLPASISVIGFVAYRFFKKAFPKFCSLATGGR